MTTQNEAPTVQEPPKPQEKVRKSRLLAFEFDEADLRQSAATLKRFVPQRPSLPIIKNVLVTAKKDGTVTFLATDLDAAAFVTIEAKVKKQGKAVIPFKGLLDKANGSGTAQLTVEKIVTTDHSPEYDTNGHVIGWNPIPKTVFTASLVKGPITLSAAGRDPDDFPPSLGPLVKGPTTSLPGEFLETVKRVVMPAAAREESRPVLTGIYFFPKNGNLEAVGADGFRLHIATTKKPERFTRPFILPATTLRSIPVDRDWDLRLNVEGDKVIQVQFTSENITILAQTITGVFPNYPQLVPKGRGAKAIVFFEAHAAATILKALPIPETNIVRITPRNKSSWDFSTRDLEEETVNTGHFPVKPAMKVSGAKTAVSHPYLLDILAKCEGEVRMTVRGPSDPVVFEDLEEGCTLVVMPMFVQW